MNEALAEKLSAFADGELQDAEAAELAAALENQPELRQLLAAFRRLDAAAAALPVPELDRETGAALWSEVSFRTLENAGGAQPRQAPDWNELAGGLPPAPRVGEERWNKVWQGIRGGMQAPAHGSEAEPERALPLGDLSPVDMPAVNDRASARARVEPLPRRRASMFWLASAAMAAAVLFGVTAFVMRQHQVKPGDKPVAAMDLTKGAQVLDDRYFLLTKHVPGVEGPVVCFVLKDEPGSVNKP